MGQRVEGGVICLLVTLSIAAATNNTNSTTVAVATNNTAASMTCGTFHCDCVDVTKSAGDAADGGDKRLLGITSATVGSLGAAVGLVLQKLAHNEEEVATPNSKSASVGGMVCSCKWISGLVLLIVFPLPLELIAVSLAPQSVIEPLAGASIIFAQVLAPCVLGEKVRRMDWVATFVIVCGCVLSSMIGDQCSAEYTIVDIKALFLKEAFIIIEVLVLIVMTAFFVYVRLPQPAGMEETTTLALCHAFLGGAFCGQQNVLFKAVGEVLEDTIAGDNSAWSDWAIYVILVGVCITSYYQLAHLNQGLMMIPAVKFLPIYSSSLIINSTGMGLVFYQEYKLLTSTGLWSLFGCMVVIIGGVLMLTIPDDMVPEDFGSGGRIMNLEPLTPTAAVSGAMLQLENASCFDPGDFEEESVRCANEYPDKTTGWASELASSSIELEVVPASELDDLSSVSEKKDFTVEDDVE